jgi:hypothetical protein
MDARVAFLLANLRPDERGERTAAQLEQLAGVYLANPALRFHGVPFCDFVANPGVHLMRVANPLRDRELTAKDRAKVRQAIARTFIAGNGRHIEKLRHHAHPRGRRDFIQERDA